MGRIRSGLNGILQSLLDKLGIFHSGRYECGSQIFPIQNTNRSSSCVFFEELHPLCVLQHRSNKSQHTLF